MRRVFQHSIETERQNILWKSAELPKSKCECKSQSSKACTSAFLIDLFIIILFLESSQTRHSDFKYWNFYVSGFGDKRLSSSPDNCILHHETAPPHIEVLAKRHLSSRQIPISKICRTCMIWTLVVFMIPRLKMTTKGSHFEQFAGIQGNLSSLPQGLSENYF
jgi:hypothetical protein